jgi:ABC-type polysaccharide/polyol phosphate transport system ATPase subunit
MGSANIAVSVTDASKKFRLYHERSFSLKEILSGKRFARYDELWALRDVTLEIDQGSTFGLIGPNGSGKSTLLRLIAGIHPPTSGTVKTRGRVAALLELGAGFHPELTGRENIYLNGAIMGLTRREVGRVFDQIVEFSGLKGFIDSPVKIYSSGMYVRLGFSVAVNLDPEILLIDEILAVGDEEFRRKSLDHVYKLRATGTTIVLVSHSLEAVQTMCERVAWFDHGQLVEEGPSAQVVDHYLENVDREEAARLSDIAETSTSPPSGRGKEIEVRGVEFLDDRGEPAIVIRTGRTMSVRVRYHALSRHENATFVIDLFHENGTHVAQLDSSLSGFASGGIEGEGYLDCRIEEVPLLAGTYLVSVRVSDVNQLRTFDRKEKAYVLHVQAPRSAMGQGMVELNGTWNGPIVSSSM